MLKWPTAKPESGFGLAANTLYGSAADLYRQVIRTRAYVQIATVKVLRAMPGTKKCALCLEQKKRHSRSRAALSKSHHDPAVLEIDLQNQSGLIVACVIIRIVVLQVD